MFLSMRNRSRSTLNFAAVNNAIVGVETMQYPKGNIISTSHHTLMSEGVTGAIEECFDDVHRRPFNGSNGGPFLLRKVGRYPGFTGVSMNCSPFGVYYEYNGSLYTAAPVYGGVGYSLPPDSFGDTSNRGAEAWNRFRPGNPAMSLGVFLAELRDMPGMVRDLREKCKLLQNMRGRSSWRKFSASRDFLSYQFAWKPFVKDVLKMSQEAFSYRRRLDRLQKSSGVWQSVSGSLSDGVPEYSDTTHSEGWGGVYPILNTLYFGRPNETMNRVAKSQRVWFSGKMRYYMPPMETSRDRFNVMRRMYGLTLTPDLVWNIMPWSWLIDWFTNVGDVMSNITSGVVDDLVAAWAYVMGHTIMEAQQVVRCYPKRDGVEYPTILTGRTTLEVKRRDSATPFGFGLDAGDLTLRQLAILSALGLSR